MDFLCVWFCAVCGTYVDSGKMRHPPYRLGCGDGDPHDRGSHFSWIMVFVVGAQDGIAAVSGKTWLFLILSGLATGASWLCYFHALQAGDVNKVVPIDKSSTILTIVLAFLFLGEEVSALKIVCVILIGAGTFLMIQKKETEKSAEQEKKSWLLYACLSAVLQVSLRFSARSASRDSIPISERQSGRRWCS